MKSQTISAFKLIMSHQRRWAVQNDLELVEDRRYLPTVRENLFAPLSKATKRAFELGGGKELEDTDKRPAKMRALHSSSALVCNLFDYWITNDTNAIGRCLGLEENPQEIRFEVKLPTGLGGTPPTPDLLIIDQSDCTTIVESKFTEPFRPKRYGGKKRPPFAKSYFDDPEGIWRKLGLPRCQTLAKRLSHGERLFHHLDAPQLLKHAIGLKRAYPTGALTLLWFDLVHAEGSALRREIQKFEKLVDDELGFNAIRHQTVFQMLRAEALADPNHLSYLESRYFSI